MNAQNSEPGWLRLEPIFLGFEEAWRSGRAPDLECAASAVAAEDRCAVLTELIKIDLEYRWRNGEQPSIDGYLQRFPELSKLADAHADLMREELRLRRDHDRSHSAPAGSDPVASPKRHLGKYELGEQIGQGGFATVYRGWDPELRRDVAVKVLRSEYGQHPDVRARILREAQSAARLRHPAIVPIYEVGQDGEQFFIVYEFIPGNTLAQTLQQTQPAPMQIAQWIARLAEALDYAHGQGIVHRDVKPANVMMDRDGQPMLADFGLALNLDAGATLTQEGDLLGTPAYMSPEQASGQGHAVDGRSDVYSLGVVLYEALAGKVPFAGIGPSILHQVLHEEPPSLRRVRPDIPVDLETICAKAMAKEPSRRYATAGALAEDLRRYVNHLPILARPIGPFGRLLRWSRRKPALAGTIAAAVMTIAVVIAVSFWQITNERDRFRQERDRAEQNLYRALVGQAKAQMQARDTGWWWTAMEHLGDAAKLDVPERNLDELRELAIACMGTEYPCFRLKETWTGHSQPITTVVASPDRRWVASGSKDRSVRLWKVPGGTQVVLAGHTDAITSVTFHHETRWLASAAMDGTVRLWDLRAVGGESAKALTPARTLDFKIGPVRAVAFAPEGDEIAVAGSDGEIVISSVSAENPIRRWRGHRGAVTSLILHNNGKVLFSAALDNTLRVWDTTTGAEIASWNLIDPAYSLDYRAGSELLWADRAAFGVGRAQMHKPVSIQGALHRESVNQARWQTNGRILTGGGDGSLQLWHPTSYKQLAIARGDFGPVTAFASSNDNKAVFAGYQDGRLRWWELAEPRERRIQVISDNAAFRPDSNTLFNNSQMLDLDKDYLAPAKSFALAGVIGLAIQSNNWELIVARHDGSLMQFDMEKGNATATKANRGSKITSAAPDPARMHLATASADGRVRIWNCSNGTVESEIVAKLGEVHQVAWSRDGKHLAAAGEYGIALWALEDPATPRWRLPQSYRFGGALAFGERHVAWGDAAGDIVLCDAVTGKETGRLKGHTGGINALAFSSDARRLASCAEDQTVRLWDLATQKDQLIARPPSAPTWLMFDPKDHYLACGLRGHGTDLHDLAKDRGTLRFLELVSLCGQFSPDGATLLLGSVRDGVASCSLADLEKALDAGGSTSASGTPTFFRQYTWVVPGGHSSRIWGLAVSPKGDRLVTTSHDHTAKLWNTKTLELMHTWNNYTNVVWGVAFSADGKLIATGSEQKGQGDIKVYDADTGKIRWHFQDHKRLVVALAFHPTQPLLASASLDGSVRLWNVADGVPLGLLHQFDQPVHGLAFRPDGRWLVAACHDRNVALWDCKSTAARPPDRILAGHKNTVWAVTFDAAGRTLASGADDGTILLWDAESFQRITTLRADITGVRALTFSGDGQLLAAAGFPTMGIIWNLGYMRQTLRGLNLDWPQR